MEHFNEPDKTLIIEYICQKKWVGYDIWNYFIFRGKGDNYRLGHGTEEHVRVPKQLEYFAGKKVVDLSVGFMHCLAVTEEGEVFGWGRNDQGQLGDLSIQYRTEPTPLPGLDGKKIVGAACGPSQVSWTGFSHSPKKSRVT